MKIIKVICNRYIISDLFSSTILVKKIFGASVIDVRRYAVISLKIRIEDV
jgi:hypothetical protein